MIYEPQQYAIADEPMKSFIDEEEIWGILNSAMSKVPGVKDQAEKVRGIIQKSLSRKRLTMQETAELIAVEDPQLIEEIREGAEQLKKLVYGNRIVLFAPLYVGNQCTNDCQYCGFRISNREQKRVTLTEDELVSEVKMLEDAGQKRLILVYGEHPKYDAEFIAGSVKTVYGVKKGNGEIRRVNINAAPLDIDGFRTVKAAGIGTYQIFQETYDREAYRRYHPAGRKSDYNYRLTALDRAQEAGIDDVGIGALFGLNDWRFELLALIRHVNHLEAVYNVGPHTISFPRLKNASNVLFDERYMVSDEDFTKLVAILRLAVPYTGLILTAREPAHIRKEVLKYGVSQIDGGTKIELKAYSGNKQNQELDAEQFQINDSRSLNEVMDELISEDYLPSFCTACYRTGRTGEHFMEFSVPGFIKRYCTPNAMLTLAEYLEDYAPSETRKKGYSLIKKSLQGFTDEPFKRELLNRLEKVKEGERDLYF